MLVFHTTYYYFDSRMSKVQYRIATNSGNGVYIGLGLNGAKALAYAHSPHPPFFETLVSPIPTNIIINRSFEEASRRFIFYSQVSTVLCRGFIFFSEESISTLSNCRYFLRGLVTPLILYGRVIFSRSE